MAFYSIFSDSLIQSGAFSANGAFPERLQPYIKNVLTEPFHGKVPIAVHLLKREENSQYPIRLIYISAGQSIYLGLEQNEISYITGKYNLPFQHNLYEFSYVLQGEAAQLVEGNSQVSMTDDCYFQSPHVVKCESYAKDFMTVTLYLTPAYMDAVFEELHTCAGGLQDVTSFMNYDYVNFSLKDKYRKIRYASEVRKQLNAIVELLMEPMAAGRNMLLLGHVSRMLYGLMTREHYDMNMEKRDKNAVMFCRIDDLLRASYGKINRQELSEQLNYSGDYINTIVKRYTGMNITRYRNTIAIQRASFLLLHSTKSITDIYLELNFQDKSYFYKKFKEQYGVTPKEFRKVNE